MLAIITLVAFESLAISTVMPLVEDDLGDLWLYGWVFSGFFLGNLVATVVAGRAADRVRPVVPFAAGLVLFVAGLAIGGAASGMVVLVLGRVLQGLGGGAMPAVAYVCIGRGYEPELRPRMFAMLSSAWVLPSLVGPAVAGVVGESLGWRWVFLGLLPLSAGIGAMAIVGVRSIGVGERAAEPAPVGRAVAVAAGAGLVLAGLGQRNVLLAVPLVLAGVALAVPAFLALTPRGTRRAAPGLPATVVTRGVLTLAFFTSDAFVPFALTAVKGASSAVAGLALTAAAVTWTTGAWIQARFVDRVGPRRLVRTGLVIIAAGAGGMLLTLLPAAPVGAGLLAWGVAGLGMGLAYAPLSVTALAEAETGREGAATSALQLSDMLGTALGTGLGGVLLSAGVALTDRDSAGLTAVFGLSVAAALGATLLARRVPDRLRTQAVATG